MSIGIQNFHDNSGLAATPVVPDVSVGVIQRTLAASANIDVKHGRTTTGAAYAPTDSYWVVAMRSVVSWNFYVAAASGSPRSGLTLSIYLSHGDASSEKLWRQYALHLADTNEMAGLFIPGWTARFNLVDRLGDTDHYVEGFIKIQGLL